MVNVGIIGAGRIGKVHVESICTQVKDAKVKMLADPFMNDETAKWAKEETRVVINVIGENKKVEEKVQVGSSHSLALKQDGTFPVASSIFAVVSSDVLYVNPSFSVSSNNMLNPYTVFGFI